VARIRAVAIPPGQEVFVKSTETEHSPNANIAVAGEIANG
jgi:hypothetical protein